MKTSGKTGGVSHTAARAALERVLDSGVLETSPKLAEFLRYVVTEELEGRGGAISPHAIAVKALDRPESFDPRTDPVVRVFATRLRTALGAYYQGSGRDDPVHISIPKGTYRPNLRITGTGNAPDAEIPPAIARVLRSGRAVTLTARPAYLFAGLLFAAVLVGAGAFHLILHGWHIAHEDFTASVTPAEPLNMPVVEVLPFDHGLERENFSLVEGIRQQLIFDLSHFRMFKVRVVNAFGASGTNGVSSPYAGYQVLGSATPGGERGNLYITVRDMTTGAAIWNEPIALPTNDAEYQNLLVTAVRSIVTQLASNSGVLQTEAFRRIEERRQSLSDNGTSEYECIAQFYAFDLTKSPDLRAEVHDCLAGLIAAGSRNSMVWSSWSLMQYLDWTRTAPSSDTVGPADALAAAQRAIELDPSDASGHNFASLALRSEGEFDAAVKASERALELNPSMPDYHVHLGWQHLIAGERDKGIEEIRTGIAMSPSPPGWMRLPLSFDAFDRGDYAEALDQARMIVEKGDSRGIVLGLAAALALDDDETAQRYYADFMAAGTNSVNDPMREIRNLHPDPDLIGKYEEVLARLLAG